MTRLSTSKETPSRRPGVKVVFTRNICFDCQEYFIQIPEQGKTKHDFLPYDYERSDF